MPDTAADDAPDAQPAEPPDPIWTGATTWDLGADPAWLESAAAALQSLGSAASGSQEAVDVAAYGVAADGAWEGHTATAYQEHRGRLTGDLGGLATAAADAAEALVATAAVLRFGQGMLDGERDRLDTVPQVPLPWGRTFQPRDEAEATAVRTAVAAAGEIRAWVDQEILARKPAFDTAGSDLGVIRDAWQPRTLRHVNLNAGMGRGAGTVRSNLDELAEAIAAGNPDVVTLQEVIEGNLCGEDGLLAHLEETTGGQWEVAAFTDPVHPVVGPGWDRSWDAWGLQSYGNAVLVRTDGIVAGHSEAPPLDLTVEGFEEAEDREAAVARVRVEEPER